MSDSESDDAGSRELVVAARKGDLPQVKRLLKDWPSPESLEESLQSALEGAVQGGQDTPKELFQQALDHGWDINGQTEFGSRILTSVLQTQSVSLVRWFLDHGADPTLRGSRAGVPGAHMLEIAAASSSPAVLDILLEQGLKLDDTDALHSAAGAEAPPGRVEMMAHLLDLGMDVNAIERRGQPSSRGTGKGTPLHSAVYIDQKDHVAFLLQKGADKEVRNTLGQTVMEFVVAQESQCALELLRDS